MTKLWENSNPKSVFSAKSISLNLSGYDMIKVIFGYSDSNPCVITVLDLKNANGQKGNAQAINLEPTSMYYALRGVTINSTSVQFDNAHGSVGNSTNMNNYVLIPLAIYGIKGIN